MPLRLYVNKRWIRFLLSSGTIPTAPSGLSASTASTSEIDLSWIDNSSNETGFQIQRSPDGSTWSNLTTVGVNATSFSDTGLASATTYYYRVSAFNGAGSSAFSSTASATTSGGVVTLYTLIGPSTGPIGSASSNFTATLGAGTLASPVTVTPNDSSGGGTFSPTTVTLTNASRSATFTYTAPSGGSYTIGTTNSGGLTDPATLPYAASAAYMENFDSDTIGQLPSGWVGNTSTGSGGGWLVQTTRAYDGTNGISFTDHTSAWAGLTTLSTVNQMATVNCHATGAYAGVFVRGTGINTTTPTFYAAEIASGSPVIRISKVVAGVRTQLAIFGCDQSQAFVGTDTTWLRVEFEAVGTHLKAYFFWYSNGNRWITQSNMLPLRTAVLDIYDSSITTGTACGICSFSATQTAYLDTFTAIDITGTDVRPTISLTAPSAGTVSGTIAATVSATGGSGSAITQVMYALDPVVANGFTINFGNIRFQSPWSCNIDTLRWLDGTHTLAARAYDANGNWQDSAPVSLTVSNGASASVTVPSLPARHSWVKLGVTSESSPDSSMQAAVLNDVSWAECTTTVGKVTPSVVNGWCDAASVSRIGTIIYTNVNNLYSFFLWDWNRYADANSVSRELGFLHVCTPFAQTYTYASTVHRASSFWGCYLKTGAGPYTELLHDPDSPAVGKYRLTSTQTFAASVNDYLAIGYTERFRQIILTMVTPASGGWTYVIEYPNAVDGSSVPTSWGTITPTTDGTSGLTTSGTISFEPPSDWAGSSPDGRTDYLQWIRIRTTHTGTTPSTSAVYAEDYLGTKASSNAIVPVFDNQADANGDGYLNDTEYANRRSGMDARFNYWSRLNTAYGDGEPVTNMSESAYRDWVASYMGAIATSNGATGLFIDNATYNYGPGTMQGWRGRFSTVEPWDWMLADHGSACMRVWQVCAVSGGSLSFCVANVMGGGTLNDIGVATRCPALWREQLLRPLFDNATAMGTNRTVLLTDTSYHGGDCICLPGSKSEDSLFEAPGTVTGSPTSSSFVGSSDLDNVKTYATAYMQFTSGVLASSGPNQITTYTPSTRTFGFSTPWSQAPTAGDAFVISGMDAAGILYSYHVHSTPTALWTGLALYQDRRLQVSTAAYYYCVATPSSYLVPFNATASTPVQPVTARATAFNVGALTETTGGTPLIAGDNIGPKVWATGIDPYDGVSTYKVMIRHYANATILFRPYAAAQALAMGAPMGNTSAVSLSLTAEHSAGFKQVLFDGSLDSTVITSISLRNGEGAILVPQ